MPDNPPKDPAAAAAKTLWDLAFSFGEQWVRRSEESLARIADSPDTAAQEFLRLAGTLGTDWLRYSQETMNYMARLADESQALMVQQLEAARDWERAWSDQLESDRPAEEVKKAG